jgi:predicted TIM-barrel fold metal-dependent hydrolase
VPDDLLLKDFQPRSELLVEQHPVERAKFPAIDAHNHLGLWGGDTAAAIAQKVAEMDAAGIRATMDLDGGRLRPLGEQLARLKGAHPDRFYVLSALPWQEEVEAGGDFGQRLASRLEQDIRQGADGLKIFKSLGLGVRGRDGKYILPDDPRIAAVFATCGELKAPCLYHVADPIAFFKPLDRFNERWEELTEHPNWHVYGDAFPSYAQLMESQEKLLEQHPATTFQAAHLASTAEDLAYAAQLLDRYPNLNMDLSERIAELGRQPYTARRFLIKYADRILYGTDKPIDRHAHRLYCRFLETFDEYFPYSPRPTPPQGRWQICGVGLPDEVLRKIYYRNAQRLYGKQPR